MKPLGLLVVAALAVNIAAVDKNNFKTCQQSGFCKRLREFKPEKSQYALNLDSVMIHGNVLSAEVNTVDTESDKKVKLWQYALRLSALAGGTFRVELDEAEPLYPRYRTQLALDGEPKADSLKLESKEENGKLTLANSLGEKVVIIPEPLILEFYNKKGNLVVVMNENSQLLVEPLRRRREQANEDDENAPHAVEAEPEGTWGENFKSHFDSKPRGNEAVSLDISFPNADYAYGLPEHSDGLALSTTAGGEPYRLYNLDVFEYELDSRAALYAGVPVLYGHGSGHTAGVLWHNSAETWVDVVNLADGDVVSSFVNLVTGTAARRRVDTRFMSESGIVDVFVLTGPTPTRAVQQLAALTGAAPLPAKFALGYHQCRWNYVDEADVRQVNDNLDAHDIPADTLWLDIEYTDRKKYFTWDAEKFPQPAEMVANLTARGRRLIVIIDPHVKREPGYFLHEDLTSLGYYVKNKDGNDYEGWCWPGSSSYPDFLNPTVSEYVASKFSYDNFPGTSDRVHLWNDMNEPSVFNGPEITMPKDCRHYRPADGAEGLAAYWEHRHVHNEYGLFSVKATFDGMLRRASGQLRPFILARAAFAGTQRYAAVWTGDNTAEWGHLAASVPMCTSLALAGISFCGADVGGFFKYPEAELMTRWYQAGAFQPFFRAHSHQETRRREPWLYEAATTALIRDATRRRYALIDFWYTLFFEHSRDGLPIMRPYWFEFPAEEAAFTIDDQYLLGTSLLVKPVTEPGATSARVYLPGGARTTWYDADTYKRHAAAGYFTMPVTLAKIPVFQRGGSIIPRKERVRRSTELMADDPYTLVIALDANGTARGSLYIDDGESYEYQRNKYIYAEITYEPHLLRYKLLSPAASFPSRAWLERVVVAGVGAAPRAASLAQGGARTALHMTLHKGNDVLVLRKPAARMAEPWTISFSY